MGVLLNYPKFQALDDSGNPLVGGKVYTYIAGTTTNKATYSDYNLATANANPVVLDRRGEAIIYGAGSYKFVLKDSASNTIWTMDSLDMASEQGDYSFYPNPGEADQNAVSTGGSIKDILTALGTSKKATIILYHNGAANTTTYTIASNTDWSAYTNVTFKIVPGAVLSHGTYTVEFPPNIDAGYYQILNGTGLVSGLVVIRPEWFGAAGDGTTDDTTAMQKAWNCLEASDNGTTIASNLYLDQNYLTTVENTSTLYDKTFYGAVWAKGHLIGPFFEKLGASGSVTGVRLQVPLRYVRFAPYGQGYTDFLEVGSIHQLADGRNEFHAGAMRLQPIYGVGGAEALKSVYDLPYTSGGAYEIVEGDTITGATSSATAVVDMITLTGGSWAAGTAAGSIYFTTTSGTFQAENLNVGANSNVATISGAKQTNAATITFASATNRVKRIALYRSGGGDSEYIVNKNTSGSSLSGIGWRRDWNAKDEYNDSAAAARSRSGDQSLWYAGLANETIGSVNRNTDNFMVGFESAALPAGAVMWLEMPDMGAGTDPTSGYNSPYKVNVQWRQKSADRRHKWADAAVENAETLRVESGSSHDANSTIRRIVNEDALTHIYTGGVLRSTNADTGNETFPGGLQLCMRTTSKAITADASITLSTGLPNNCKILGTVLRVDVALAAGETWDAAYSGSQSIATATAVAKNTKVYKLFDSNANADTFASGVDITITKNGGGAFTAQGTIRAFIWYFSLPTSVPDAP